MSTIEALREAAQRARKGPGVNSTRGRALYELNRWKGQQRRELDEEYRRRLDEIDALPEIETKETADADVLALVAQAVLEGASRSTIRVALGKQTLQETDEIIAIAKGNFQERLEGGEVEAYTLTPTGTVHAKGWPTYSVRMHDTNETFTAVYLVTPPAVGEVKRTHMRLMPSPAGSGEILDRLWEAGVAQAIWERGK